MLIDHLQPEWQTDLSRQWASLSEGKTLMMLVDGAFVPGLFREFARFCTPVLLFESLPGCSDAARDVSPFLVPFIAQETRFERLLERCNGLPMLHALLTPEDIEQVGRRLSAWCVVEVDDHYFNFRFADTRRLPAIFDALSAEQRREFAGPALSWRYVGRDGGWHTLFSNVMCESVRPTERALLTPEQFARLVSDSEADEIWASLAYGGAAWHGLSSVRHHILQQSLVLARSADLDQIATLQWSRDVLERKGTSPDEDLARYFKEWQLMMAEVM